MMTRNLKIKQRDDFENVGTDLSSKHLNGPNFFICYRNQNK